MSTLKYISIFCLTLVCISCLNDDDIPRQVNETEVITDVNLIFTAENGMESTYTYTDPKYRTDDYQDPVILLNSNSTYRVEIEFWDRSNPDDVEDVTKEVEEEKDDHFVEYRFYQADVELTRTDNEESIDSNGIAIGLNTQWITANSAEGAVQITLIHKPETKETDDPLGNHIGGETDAEVTFDLKIE